LCYAVEGYDGYPKPPGQKSSNEINCLLNFDETFGPVLEIALRTTNFKGTPTLAVRAPCYQNESLEGKLAWTPGAPEETYTIDGRPDLAEAFRKFDAKQEGIKTFKRDSQQEDTWITIITGTECNSILYEKLLMAPAPTTHTVELGEPLEQRIIGPSQGGVYQNQAKEGRDTNELLNEEYPP
jgi:hypothetical protein